MTWHQVDPQEIQVKWLDHVTDPLTKQAGTIYNRIERFVLQQLEEPHGGRGLTLQFVQRPLHDDSNPWLWKRGSMAFWNQMEIRLQQLLHQAGREPRHQAQLQKLGWKLHEHWHDEATVSLHSKCCGISMGMNTSMYSSTMHNSKENCIKQKPSSERPKNIGNGSRKPRKLGVEDYTGH